MDRTRGDDHAIGRKRTACQPAPDVFYRVNIIRKLLKFRYGFSAFQESGTLGGPADNEVYFNFRRTPEFFQQAQTVDRAARARHADDYSQKHSQLQFLF